MTARSDARKRLQEAQQPAQDAGSAQDAPEATDATNGREAGAQGFGLTEAEWATVRSARFVRDAVETILAARLDAALGEVEARIDGCGVRNDSAQRWGITTALHIVRDFRRESLTTTDAEEATDGCDCSALCEMGPTCPGGVLAGLPGSGCHRTTTDERKSAEAERDRLRGVVERVKALADEERLVSTSELRAAIAPTGTEGGEDRG